jgi:cell division protein YceG involved in septum cleavage
MTTTEIADRLSKEKIIDDAAGFDAYINEHDFSKKVQIGEFVVTNNMTYRQLANTLTH